MDRNDIYGYVFNGMIMMPPIAMFAYAAPMEAVYWQWWAPAFFILPVVKYFSPSRVRPYVYQVSLISVLIYMVIGQVRIMFGYTFFPFYLDNFSPFDFTLPFIFTLGTVIAFPIIFEGILAKKGTENTCLHDMGLRIHHIFHHCSCNRAIPFQFCILITHFCSTWISTGKRIRNPLCIRSHRRSYLYQHLPVIHPGI